MTISANELRIGNWILNAGGQPIQVTPQRIADIDNRLVVANPIPLTEEILLKCGFEKDSYKNLEHPTLKCRWIFKRFLSEDDLLDVPFLRFDCTMAPNKDKSIPISTDIYYLHQLQNLYFALTNRELEVNL